VWSEEGEPWDGRDQTVVFQVKSSIQIFWWSRTAECVKIIFFGSPK